ncbi:MAG: DUF4886 domain-containing protein [Clostridia bacterium]|nr:DUF4886 domain-containing protein [Clostridia bacterium]
MKVLSIGNSFSTDAHKFLHTLAALNGEDIYTANLFIGGCSLETHFTNVLGNNAYYDYEINGSEAQEKISIADALERNKWDIVTIQQASPYSGMYETYQPYLNNLAELVKSKLPEVKIYFHQTWAYEADSPHPGFANYSNSQQKMYDCIVYASQQACKAIDAKLIPTGTVIQTVRNGIKVFDYENGGTSLCRDGFHLSNDYGRYTAAATWLKSLTGKNIISDTFNNLNPNLIKAINDIVNSL